MKKYLFAIIKIITCLATIPLFFIKFYHDVAILPIYDEAGELITTYYNDYYYSPLDNLIELNLSILMYISIIISITSIVLTILSFTKNYNRKIRNANIAFYIIAICLFLVVFYISSQVARKY